MVVSPVDDMAGDKVAAPVLGAAPVEDEVVVAFVTNRAVWFRWGPLGSAGVHWGPLGLAQKRSQFQSKLSMKLHGRMNENRVSLLSTFERQS